MIRIAVSKGRLSEQLANQLAEFGIRFMSSDKRQLFSISEDGHIELVYLKAQDVPTYVSMGVADLGIVGTDVLKEHLCQSGTNESLVSLFDLKFGKCQMCLAGSPESHLETMPHVRLASKYPATAIAYLNEKNKSGVVLPLQGSVELAPVLGISDFIVDLVESGQTLKAHQLVILEVLFDVSATLIANRELLQINHTQIYPLISSWEAWVNQKEA